MQLGFGVDHLKPGIVVPSAGQLSYYGSSRAARWARVAFAGCAVMVRRLFSLLRAIALQKCINIMRENRYAV